MDLSLDCETTGLDLFHSCRPFFVTISRDDQEHPLFWQWEVNPRTREVAIDPTTSSVKISSTTSEPLP
jgi:hypothetical protein